MDDERLIPQLSVSEFVSSVNQTLEYSYPVIAIEGEVASFKISQGKWVFFDLKDEESSVNCFMSLFQLRTPLEDGMKIVARVAPKLTGWGRFSVTIQAYQLSGEGTLRKSFELLRSRLEKEGLFTADRKRQLPSHPQHIGVISSTQAAGYADFIKIINERWGGLRIDVAHTQVQGEAAADQIIKAIAYFNEQPYPPEVLVIIRGGGSIDDLAAFNDELLVRAIAASRIPTLVGIGHEIDTTLADLAADVRAATPSNAAQIVVPDRRELRSELRAMMLQIIQTTDGAVRDLQRDVALMRHRSLDLVEEAFQDRQQDLVQIQRLLSAYDPRLVLAKGYAIVRGDPVVGSLIQVEQAKNIIQAEVKNVRQANS